MRHANTISKIAEIYLAAVCAKPFTFNGRCFHPKLLVVSPLLLRGFTCPTNCGACCGSFSLDYLPEERRPSATEPRTVDINSRDVSIWSDPQKDVSDRWCRHLDRGSGRCTIYDHRPFACDFELIRFLVSDDKVVLIQKQYGRAWAMLRLDDEMGAACEMLPPNPKTIEEVARKLTRLDQWAKHFGVETRVPAILEWIKNGDHNKALHLPA